MRVHHASSRQPFVCGTACVCCLQKRVVAPACNTDLRDARLASATPPCVIHNRQIAHCRAAQPSLGPYLQARRDGRNTRGRRTTIFNSGHKKAHHGSIACKSAPLQQHEAGVMSASEGTRNGGSNELPRSNSNQDAIKPELAGQQVRRTYLVHKASPCAVDDCAGTVQRVRPRRLIPAMRSPTPGLSHPAARSSRPFRPAASATTMTNVQPARQGEPPTMAPPHST